jgi:hypothetical protein
MPWLSKSRSNFCASLVVALYNLSMPICKKHLVHFNDSIKCQFVSHFVFFAFSKIFGAWYSMIGFTSRTIEEWPTSFICCKIEYSHSSTLSKVQYFNTMEHIKKIQKNWDFNLKAKWLYWRLHQEEPCTRMHKD